MNAIEAASYELAQAQSEVAKAGPTTAAAEKLNGIEARILERQTALVVIQNRRMNGAESDSDAPHVALLTLDLAGLEEIAASARTAHSAAVAAEQEALKREQHCQKAYDRAVAGQQATALLDRLHELEARLMAGIGELHELRKLETGSNFIHGQSLYRFSSRLERFQSQGVLIAA